MEGLFDVSEEFFKPIIRCLDILERGNVTIYKKPSSLWMKFGRLLLLLCIVAYYASLTMYMVKMFKGDLWLDELPYVISIYVICVQTYLKTAVVTLNKKKIKAVIVQLGSMWRTEDLLEVQINKKNALLKRLKFCYAVFYSLNMIGAWLYILAPLLVTIARKYILQQECELLFPFSCSFPFDPTGNWARYIGVYIFQTYTMFRIVYLYIGTEFLMITLCSHLVTEFTLLQEDILNIKPWRNVEEIKEIIVIHQKLIRLADKLDNIFHKSIFINITATSMTICFFGFSAKVAQGALNKLNNFVPVVAIIFPLFSMCYYCEMLKKASLGIGDSVYNHLWYRSDVRYQKLILLIIKRSQKPCCMTSMKYNPISLETFTTVLSTTWSYFSLATSLYEDEC